MASADTQPFELAIVGAGPRGICVLERLSANAGELLGDRTVLVHLIDPFPPGPGRVWRYDQSPLLRMNSMPEDVTMFTDQTVKMDGPVDAGPSLSEWVEQVRTGQLAVEATVDMVAAGTDHLAVLDGEGRRWMLGPEDGIWYRRERERWLQADPPRRLVCASCGHHNLGRHSFCVECGHRLDR